MIKLTEGSAGITAIYSQDAAINKNRFKGTFLTWIVVDGIATDQLGTPILNPDIAYADKALLLGNNFSGLGSTQADIVLGERSKNCTVVGSIKDDVINMEQGIRLLVLNRSIKVTILAPAMRDNFRMWTRGRHH